MIAYFNGSFLRKEEISISPDDRGFLFSDGVYEVVRAYGGKPFKMAEHMDRLARSLRETRIDFPGIAELAVAGAKLVARNGLEAADSILYFQITRGVAPRKHTFPVPPVSATAMVLISPAPSSAEMREKGVGAILVPEFRWSRCDIKAIGLLGSVLAVQQAKEKGAEEAIFVRDGVVTEGTHTNVLAVINGHILTHPLGNFILTGVTRGTVLELCRRLGIVCKEQAFRGEDLNRASEIIITGTNKEITPVVRLDGRPVGTGAPGPVTRRLQEAYSALVRGEQVS
jgi:D-alanine transaminase